MTSLIPVGQEWNDMKNMSAVLKDSGFLPASIKTPQQAVAIMLLGRELGVGPMESFSKISVIQGKPTIGAELMKAMVHKKLPQAKFYLKSSDEKSCTFMAARPGDEPVPFTFTREDAKAMGIAGKDNWAKQPAVMLRWRCISQVCRTVFPDCLSGITYTPEEMDPDIKVDDEGVVLETTGVKTEAKKIAQSLEEREAVLDDTSESGKEQAAFSAEIESKRMKHKPSLSEMIKNQESPAR